MFPVSGHDCAGCAAGTIGFCANLGSPAIDRLMVDSRSVGFRRGEKIHLANGGQTSALVLRRGMVKISHILMDGRQQIVDFLSAGDIIVGKPSNSEDSRTVTATTEVEACEIRQAALRKLCIESPAIGELLLNGAFSEIDRKSDQLTLLGRKRSDERVASFLLDFSARAARRGARAERLILPMSRAEIADYLSLTAETVSRALTVLREEKLIRLPTPSEVELCDIEALRQVASGGANLTVR